ncbi:MAG: hypothetical protein QGG42_09085 [Phycisphaerae bacterium]|nr:hypothetical protein [Phycisphaerae bacterium]
MTPPENNHHTAHTTDLAPAVRQCQQAPAFLQAILDVYKDIDRTDRQRQAVCMGGGACCRFDLFDHRLYATLGELALLGRTQPADPSRLTRNRCPYQQGPRCLARENRPLGCRVFFCREEPDTLNDGIYEESHRRIRQLHERHNLPYAYVELISALKILREFCR